MKNIIILTTFSSLVATLFLGCGGGDDATFKGTTEVPVAMCSATPAWTILSSQDTVSAAKSSQLRFDHDSSGVKKVCVVTGSATVLKG